MGGCEKLTVSDNVTLYPVRTPQNITKIVVHLDSNDYAPCWWLIPEVNLEKPNGNRNYMKKSIWNRDYKWQLNVSGVNADNWSEIYNGITVIDTNAFNKHAWEDMTGYDSYTIEDGVLTLKFSK